METRNLKEISKMDSHELTAVIDYWKDYDAKSVLLAYAELKRRNYIISGSLLEKQNQFCKKNSFSNIDAFLIVTMREIGFNSYEEYFYAELALTKEQIKEVEEEKEEEKLKTTIKDTLDLKLNHDKIIKNVSEAGSNVIIIYYLIVFEILFQQLHDLLIDVKIKHYYISSGNYDILNLYQEKNVVTNFILEMENINDIVEYLKYINEIYYFFQLVMFIIFMHCFWKIGEKLKNIE